MRMLQLSRELDLPLEPVHVHTGGHLGWEDLDHDLTSQPHLLGQEHATHPPATEFRLDGVGIGNEILQSVDQAGHSYAVLGVASSYERRGWGAREVA